MAEEAARMGLRSATLPRPAGQEPLGFYVSLLLLYLVMEYGRPANPLKIPLMISVILFVGWFLQRDRRWSPQIVCFLLFLGTIAVMGPFAINSFAIYSGFQVMAVQLLCICAPLMHFLNSMRRVRIFLGGWVAILAYLAVFGLFHGGTGPGGHIGDENDLALALDMAIPMAFAFMRTARLAVVRIASAAVFVLMVITVCVTFSRGGFLGLAAVLLYCFFFMTKRKVVALLFVAVAVFALVNAPEAYRERLGTIIGEAQGTEQGSGSLRQEFWAVARQMYYANPVFGVGLNNFTWNVDRYMPAEQLERMGRSFSGTVAHSLHFTLLAELGSSGAVIFVLLVWFTFRDTGRVLRVARTRDAPEGAAGHATRRDLAALALYAHAIRAALVGCLVAGTFLTVHTYPHFWVLVALTVAFHDSAAKLLGMAPDSESWQRTVTERPTPEPRRTPSPRPRR
jgi:hypothetical protein